MRKFMTKLMLIIISITSIASISISPKVEASNGTLFSVHPILPDSQVDKSKAYFDLRMEPKQKQIIEIEIKNNIAEDQIGLLCQVFGQKNVNNFLNVLYLN